MTAPIASGWSKIAGWDLHPLRNAALTRRTPKVAVCNTKLGGFGAGSADILQAVVLSFLLKPSDLECTSQLGATQN
jgi:hypothetical protein